MSSFNELIQSATPVIVDFSAEWCQPCKMMPPILKEVKKKLGEQVRVLKVDVDKNQSVSQKYQISSVPTIVIFKNGTTVFRQSGVMQASQLVQAVQPFL
jgi:thioredoxin 1